MKAKKYNSTINRRHKEELCTTKHNREATKTEPMSELTLYNITLERQSASVQCCLGNFSGTKKQEIITASSNELVVYRVDSSSGSLQQLFTFKLFSTIRSIAPVRIAGTTTHYLCVSSDSGNLTVLSMDLQNKRFTALFNEPHSKSGIRRLTPSEITVDPKGRAVMVSAIEKNRLVYVMNRDDTGLTISSPLEAHRSRHLSLSTVALDVGYENPQFASLEIDYSDLELSDIDMKKQLTFYELDLGLNHVVKKHSEQVPETSNLLIPVPGGSDGPSGVLVCSSNKISYRNLYGDKLSISIPGEDDTVITYGVSHKLKNEFFFLLQTNYGDLFKLELLKDMSLSISYFDTIQLCTSFVILKSGFLYADAETGDKQLFQFEKLGGDMTYKSTNDNPVRTWFARTELQNLSLVDVVESLAPMISSHITPNKSSNCLFSLNGVKDSSTLRMLQYGVSISEIVEPDLPATATRCFTTKTDKSDEFDKYLIISFEDRTLVLTIGESVEEVTDSGIDLSVETLGIQQAGQSSILQIHKDGVNVIKNNTIVNHWYPPAGIKLTALSSTNTQLALGLSNEDLVYFEIDQDDNLIEWNEHKHMSCKITSMSLGEIPDGLRRSSTLVVGCADSTIRVLSTDPKSTLESISLQALSSVPSSLLICNMSNQLCVHIGLENGVYVRTVLDVKSGDLSSTKQKYLGNRPVILTKTRLNKENVVIALSATTWIVHEMESFKVQPLLIEPLAYSTSFHSEDCPEGLVGVYKRKLVICTIDSLAQTFKKDSLQIQTTGKLLLEDDKYLYIILSGEGSYIQKFNENTNEIEKSVEIPKGTKIVTANMVHFQSKNAKYLVCSSTGEENLLSVYDLNDLSLIHSTKIPEQCHCLGEFQGKLIAGYGSYLRLFDMGVKQLLSKSNTHLKTLSSIVRLDVQGSRVAIGDIRDSITLVTFSHEMNVFVLFVDDIVTRHVTSLKFLDYNTVVGGDKFGNVFVLRVPESASDDDVGYLSTKPLSTNGAPFKFNTLCQFYLDDIPMSFHKTSFTPGGRDIIVYTCLLGTVGALIPLITMSDIKFLKSVEKAMRDSLELPTGRMHLKYRGYYAPVKNVIDGDLLELFDTLDSNSQDLVISETGRKKEEISRRVYDVRLGSL